VSGNRAGPTNVSFPMNVNPDPRPGRWLLPLVVLGMVAFTYVFVNQLPGEGGAATESTVDGSAASTSSTTTPDGSDPGATTPTSTAGSSTPAVQTPETAAYIDAMRALNTQLTGLQAELSSANAAWEAGGSYGDAQTAFTKISTDVATWRDQVNAVSVPAGLADAHETLRAAAEQAATQAAEALDGLVNSSGPEKRVQSVARFDEAVSAFAQALQQAGG